MALLERREDNPWLIFARPGLHEVQRPRNRWRCTTFLHLERDLDSDSARPRPELRVRHVLPRGRWSYRPFEVGKILNE